MRNAILTGMAQLVTRIDDRLLADIDRMVERGVVASRSEAVRTALALMLDRYERGQVGLQIVADYEARPQTADEVGWADEATRRMIADEPW
jgi:Arc/MetJ-type ribon-helix-helix transcriptional regulator